MNAAMRVAASGAVLVAALTAQAPAGADELFVPMPIFRTGPYAAGGSGIGGGTEDYFAMLNARDGGINGIPITWEECETAYQPDRMVECYERQKNGGTKGATAINPLGTGLTYAILERAAQDRIPLLTLGYGRTDATDGSVFPYAFPMVVNYWSQATAMVEYIAQESGGKDELEGMKIARIYHDSAYGKETEFLWDKMAEMYGFEVRHFPVAHPGLDQKATWLQIVRRLKPDWVISRGFGVMCSTTVMEAARANFPRERLLGIWWCGSEEDAVPAGSAAVGYRTTTFHAPGSDFPVIDQIVKHVHDRGNGNVERDRVGSIYYNRGVLQGIIIAEAMRKAMEKFGVGALSGEQVQWGLEHLDFTPARISELGAEGLMPPIKTSCQDHEGGGQVKVQEWDGEKWTIITPEWIKPDHDLVRAEIEKSAAKYAAEKGITPRDCSAED